MKLVVSRIHLLAICSIILGSSATTCAMSSLRKYVPFLSKTEHKETITKEYKLKPGSAITVKTSGTITVKSDWHLDKVMLTATKRAPKPELLTGVSFDESATFDSLSLIAQSKEPQATIDFDLIIPSASNITLSTEHGNITIGDMKGKICATTTSGNISIDQAYQTIIATTLKNGSIAIKHARGNVKASTIKGNISIDNAYSSILAQAENGSIDVRSASVPATSKIKLVTNVGLINLSLPADVNADLQANTKRGAVVSQHKITLKPKTTTLDSKAWRQMKERVDGILGTGEATISLSSNKGNIKILNAKTKTA